GTVLLRTEPGGRWASTESREALRAVSSPSLPSSSPVGLRPVPESPRGAFPALCRLPQDGSVPASAPQCRHRLDEPGRREVRHRASLSPLLSTLVWVRRVPRTRGGHARLLVRPDAPLATSASSISCHPEA